MWQDYKGVKSYLRTTVVWPIGVASDNTDSIYSPGALSFHALLIPTAIGLCSKKNVLVIWGHSRYSRLHECKHFLTFPQGVPFSLPLSAILTVVHSLPDSRSRLTSSFRWRNSVSLDGQRAKILQNYRGRLSFTSVSFLADKDKRFNAS